MLTGKKNNQGKHGPCRRHCISIAGQCLGLWYFDFDIPEAGVKAPDEFIAERREFGGGHIIRTIMDNISSPIRQGMSRDHYADRDYQDIAHEIALIQTVAGITAEAKYEKVSAAAIYLSEERNDFLAYGYLLSWWPDQNGQRRVDRISERRAKAIVRSESGQAAIEAISEALMTRGRLDGEEIAELCRIAYGGRQPQRHVWFAHWPPSLQQLRAGLIPSMHETRRDA